MSLQVMSLCPLIQVYDMPEAVGFYRDLLGFQIVGSSEEVDAPEGRYFQWAWLRLGGAELMLNTAYDVGERPSVREAARQAVHQDTALFFECADVDAAYKFLRKQGLDPKEPVTTAYGMKQLWLIDPDNYALCFQSPSSSR